MFVGHALLAFALVGAVAARLGVPRDRALVFAGAAAGFAAVPDVDIGYAVVGVVRSLGDAGGPLALAESFWATGNVVHRGPTHSLVLAVPAAVGAGLLVAAIRARGRRRTVAVGVAALAALSVPVAAGVAGGPLAAAVSLPFVLAVLAVAGVVATRGVGARTTTLLALAGLLSHPFGDLFTGTPPAMLYPLPVTVVAERVSLHPDPTLHLLAAFGVELAVVWAALAVYVRLRGRRLAPAVAPRAMLGAAYVAVVPLIPAPTLDLSYPFVFSVLAVSLVGVAPLLRRRRWRPTVGSRVDVAGAVRGTLADGDRLPAPGSATHRAVVTGVAAVTCAWLAAVVVYAV